MDNRYLVRVFYQPDPQSCCQLQQEKMFYSKKEAEEFASKWHPCAYVTKILKYGTGWFNI